MVHRFSRMASSSLPFLRTSVLKAPGCVPSVLLDVRRRFARRWYLFYRRAVKREDKSMTSLKARYTKLFIYIYVGIPQLHLLGLQLSRPHVALQIRLCFSMFFLQTAGCACAGWEGERRGRHTFLFKKMGTAMKHRVVVSNMLLRHPPGIF